MKKYLKLLFTFLMTFVVAATVSADTTYKIVVNNADEGHTYEAYQIFKGTLSQDTNTLSDIEWGTGVSAAFKTAKGDAATYAKSLKNMTADQLRAAVKEMGSATNLGSVTKTVSTQTNGKYVIEELPAGYYIVKDQEGSQTGEYDAYTEYLVKLPDSSTSTTTINVKTGKPTIEKEIVEATGGVTSTVNYSVGDKVPYQLTGTMPSNYDHYTTYKYVFHDTTSTGLEIDENSVKVYVGSTQITTGFTPVVSSDKHTLTVTFDDTKTISSITAASEIIVKYDAEITDAAIVGSTGNKNTAYLEYSNNPNGTGTGRTTEVETKVYLIELIINKVDENGNALEGAEFTLTRNSDGKSFTVVKAGNVFTVTDLAVGTYTLTETVVPDGYNKIDPITINISATSDENGLVTLNGTGLSFTANLTLGTLTADVENIPGVELPLTGGIGTILFTVIGSALMAIAAIGLLKNKEEK